MEKIVLIVCVAVLIIANPANALDDGISVGDSTSIFQIHH